MMECWENSQLLEGHAPSWPDATERVPPKVNQNTPLFHASAIPLFRNFLIFQLVTDTPDGVI
jgi:hypothetical protein